MQRNPVHHINYYQRERSISKVYRTLSSLQPKTDKRHNIERLKHLEAMVFKGSTNLEDDEDWLNLLVKCFKVMDCPEDKMVRLPTFLLQKEAEGQWMSIIIRRGGVKDMDWKTFKGIFEDKYYSKTYCEAKREEF